MLDWVLIMPLWIVIMTYRIQFLYEIKISLECTILEEVVIQFLRELKNLI